MNQKRNRKRHTVYIGHSMIMQRLGSKPMGRHRGIRGAITMEQQEPTTSIKTTICSANGHHERTPSSNHTNDHMYRQWRSQLHVPANSTSSPPTKGHSIVAANRHSIAATTIEVQ